MNDSVLVEALRARDPGALAALYDTYAESIYRYARTLLEGPDSAQVALRDTLIAAEAHVHALADPGRLRVWLYALARGECVRRRSALRAMEAGDETEAAPAAPGGADGDLRLVAVNAVAALPEDEREVLDLLTRHGIPEHELAAVLGTTAEHAEQLHQSACHRLQDLVTTEILTRNASPDCDGRERVLDGFTGELDQRTRELLLEHIDHCTVCAPHRERQVSAAKVFNLLPLPELPETLRVRVMSCFIDPELVPYRRLVARRTGLLDPAGFPVHETKRARRAPALVAGAVAALAIVVAAAALVGAVRDAEGPAVSTGFVALPAPDASSSVPASPGASTRPHTSLTPIAAGTSSAPPGRSVVLPVAPVVAIGPTAAAFAPPRVSFPASPTTRAPRPPRPSSPAPTARPSAPTPRPSAPPTATPPGQGPPTAPPSAPPTPPRPPRERPPVPRPSHTHQNHPRRTPCPQRTRPAPAATPTPTGSGGSSPAPTGGSSPAPTGSAGSSSSAPTDSSGSSSSASAGSGRSSSSASAGSGRSAPAGRMVVRAARPQGAGRVHRQ
ncbi:RNA polymerase sigma factor [Sphaerisporangium sp. NPDC004334]